MNTLVADCWYWLLVLALVPVPATRTSNQQPATSLTIIQFGKIPGLTVVTSADEHEGHRPEKLVLLEFPVERGDEFGAIESQVEAMKPR